MGVLAPRILPILVIGLLDCVGGPLGCSDWLGRLPWWAWLAGRRMSVRGAVVVCPRVVRIEHIRHCNTLGHFSSTLLCVALPFGVELVVPWDTLEAVIYLHLDRVIDLETDGV